MRWLLVVCIVLFISSYSFSQTRTESLKRIFYQLTSASPQISISGGVSGGSALRLSDGENVYIATARHNLMIQDATSSNWSIKYGEFVLNQYVMDEGVLVSIKYSIDLSLAKRYDLLAWNNDKTDLLLIKIGVLQDKVINYIPNVVSKIDENDEHEKILNAVAFQYKDFADSTNTFVGNEIYVIGYPNSVGLNSVMQYDTDQPLFRRGIIAQLNQKNETIIIDAASFPGNSGSPVVQFVDNKASLIGLLTELIEVNPRGRYVGNSGYSVVVPIEKVRILIEKFNSISNE